MKNTGVPAEVEFRARRKGRGVYIYEFEDQKALVGLNKGKSLGSRAKPCDYIVIDNGQVIFAEVKSSHDPTAFRFSMIRVTQHGFAKLITHAGGRYHVYIKNMATEEWFCVPYEAIAECVKQSMSWAVLRQHYPWRVYVS